MSRLGAKDGLQATSVLWNKEESRLEPLISLLKRNRHYRTVVEELRDLLQYDAEMMLRNRFDGWRGMLQWNFSEVDFASSLNDIENPAIGRYGLPGLPKSCSLLAGSQKLGLEGHSLS